jgi:hypothetical protein
MRNGVPFTIPFTVGQRAGHVPVWALKGLQIAICLACPSLFSPLVLGNDFSWNAGNGSWHDANNWTPNGVPGGGFVDVIRIGDLPGIQNSTVILGPSTTSYHSLSISSGMTLDMAGGQLGLFRAPFDQRCQFSFAGKTFDWA